MDVRDNFTDFTLASNYIMQLAIDEYQADRNWTRLIDRYWNLVEDLIGGNYWEHTKLTLRSQIP